MLLDIIVPHYKEPWEVVRPFVDMINNQRGIDFNDFRVTIVHDGVDPFPVDYLKGPANICQVRKPNGGVSAARNYGFDMSTAEWINFSDCDDCYSSIFALWHIFRALKQNPPYDLLWSPFYMVKDHELKWFRDYNAIFVHNKYYRRSFLKDNDIRFCEKLYMSEDSAFNGIIEMKLDKGRVGQINVKEPVYAWCRRGDSITMDPSRWVKNAEGHFDRNLYILEACKTSPIARPDLMTVRTMCDAYSMLTQPNRVTDSTEPFETRVAKFYRNNKEYVENVSEHDLDRLIKLSDMEAGASEYDRNTRMPFVEWLEFINKKYP